MRRWVSLLVGALLLACGGGQKAPKGLVIWESYNDEEHQVFMEIVRDFEKAHPGVKVEVQRIPFTGMENKLLTALATRTTPDIARVDYAFVAKLAEKNALYAIPDSAIADLRPDLVPAAFQANLYKGKMYGLPDQTTCVALFYNRELFRQAGIQAPPRTWEEFVAVAKKLTRPEKGIYGFAMRNSLWWTFPFFYTFGARFLSEDLSRCLLDSPEAIAGFSFKVDLYRKHKVEAGAWRSGAINPDVGFRNNKYAMIFNGPWAVKSLENAGVPFGVALIPAGPTGTGTTVGGTNMVIFRASRNKALALAFLKFLLSPENQARWANALGQIPVNLKAFDKVDTLQHPYLKVFMEQMRTAVPRPPIPNYSEIELIFNAEMEAALSGQKSPADALRDATRKANELLQGEAIATREAR